MHDSTTTSWIQKLHAFVPSFLAGHPVLSKTAGRASILLHGSTTLGIDDPWSDLDLWILLPAAALAELRQTSNDWFFDFTLDGKCGHFNLESQESFDQRIGACDFPLIAELRHAVVLSDPTGRAQRLIDLARLPMRSQVRRAWFCYHYVEMRGEHRAIDNPIERGDPVAILLAMTKALEHALQAALVLDGRPYPYSKWLARACQEAPTGRAVLALVQDALSLLAQDNLRRPGPEKTHPLSLKLREIRHALVAAARAGGIDEPWLDKWWLFCQYARSVRDIPWRIDQPDIVPVNAEPSIPGLTIRPATANDVPLVISFIRKLAAYEKLSHEVVATEDLLRETLFGPCPKAEVVLAYCEGQPVGFALFFHNFSTFLGRPGIYLEDLYVDETCRGKGIGKALLVYLAQLARRRSCGRLEWWVLDWNEPAIRFYESLGAVAMKDWTVYRLTGAALDRLADNGGSATT